MKYDTFRYDTVEKENGLSAYASALIGLRIIKL